MLGPGVATSATQARQNRSQVSSGQHRSARQTSSIAIAVASPPPMQSARDAALLAVLAQRAEQRHEDPRARRADRMTERAGAAVHVDLVVRDAVLLHRRHRHDRERLVDLEEVDVLRRPAGLPVQLLDRADRRRREEPRLLRVRRVRDDHRERREPALLGRRAAHQHQRRRAVGDRARVRRGHRAVLAKRRLQRRHLVGRRLRRLLVLVDHDVALAARHRDRRDLPRERAVVVRGERARERRQRECVLRLARERDTCPRSPRRTCPSAGPCRRRPRGRRGTCGPGPPDAPSGSPRAPSASGTARSSCSPCRRRRRCPRTRRR